MLPTKEERSQFKSPEQLDKYILVFWHDLYTKNQTRSRHKAVTYARIDAKRRAYNDKDTHD